MLANYFKTGLRNLSRSKGYSAINIAGLAVGMAVTMLIGLWIYDEVGYDKYHKNYNSIGHVWGGGTDPETSHTDGTYALSLPTAAALKNNYGRYFKHVLLSWWTGGYTLLYDDKKLTRTGVFIEPGAPEMLSLKMLQGDYNCLKDPHSILIAQSTARAIFGEENAMGKILKVNNKMDVKVTGVYEDIPENNQFGEMKFFSSWDLWVANNAWIQSNINNWDNRSYNVYVQIQPNTSWEQVNAAIKDIYLKDTPGDYKKWVSKYKPFLQAVPMSTWHLYSEFKDGKPAGGRITFVWLFGIIGFFVLLLACINFMNLSTARSEKRAKEVGIRKAIGSLKSQLVRQFLGESFLVVVISFLLSVLLVFLSLPLFNELADKHMSLPLNNAWVWVSALVFIVITSFMAGLYPAFYLSSFRPVKVLKGTVRSGRFASIPRKTLVVVQFTVSVMLIIGTVIVYQQIQHARNRPAGYNRHGLVSVDMSDPGYRGKLDALKSELLNTGVVTGVAYSNSPLTQIWNNSGGFSWPGRDPKKDNDFALCNVALDYGEMVGWQFVEGRDFSKDFAMDSATVILNETAVRYMGLKDPLGKVLRDNDSKDQRSWTIIGVIKDMLMESPYEPVKQTIYFFDKNNETANVVTFRMKPGVNTSEAITKIGKVFRTIVPSASFDYKFVDDDFGAKFSQEERIGKLSGFFTVLAIFISCLGLFGLASFVAEQRSKEIGIRKVIGASVFDLWKMLSKDFVILVVIACFIAIPVAYSYMNGWLQKYNYHTTISWWIFAIAVGGALLITLMTVSFQAIRAAIMNPVKSLKAE